MQAEVIIVANYISELGADGTSSQRLTNTLLFPMVGISLIAILIALWHRLPERAAIRAGLVCLGLGLALAYLGAAIFPCDYAVSYTHLTLPTIYSV